MNFVVQSSSDEDIEIWSQFDTYCKIVLKNEAINCYVEIERHRRKKKFFSELTEQELEQLCMEDEYEEDICSFQVLGYDVKVKDMLLGEALKLLSEKKRKVVLMSYYLDMSETEIAEQLNLKQSTIHYHKKSSLEFLKQQLEVKANEM